MKNFLLGAVSAVLLLAYGGTGVEAGAEPGPIRAVGKDFKDAAGRTLILRGVNLGGDSKIPALVTADPKDVSYIGRPFPLAEADTHFARLASWGLTFVRLITPWEAIEHAGPGQYDTAYLDYLHEIVRIGGKHGISFYIDAHQDGFSRAFGGDGAPYWASAAVGLGVDKDREAKGEGALKGHSYWPPPAGAHAASTMNTLFWAGNDFAPGLKVGGIPVQAYLQDHYIGALRAVALRLRGLDNVAGYDTFNEPSGGYIGVQDLSAPDPGTAFLAGGAAGNSGGAARTVTSFDTIMAASGFAKEPDPAVKPVQLWASGRQDIWRQFGVWDVVDGTPKLLKPNYFATVKGQPADFHAYLKDFQLRLVQAIRQVAPDALIFQETSPFAGTDKTSMALGLPGIVHEPHWYDVMALISAKYVPGTTIDLTTMQELKGEDNVTAAYLAQLTRLQREADARGGIPTIFGEVGLPMNMNDRAAYRTGDFSAQDTLAKLQYGVLDRLLASYTVWNYSASNTNEKGDGWLSEDLSIYSRSQRTNPRDINSGGRALQFTVRPYPAATAGQPLVIDFDGKTRRFHYRFEADPAITASTEIFVPAYHYAKGVKATTTSGKVTYDKARSRLIVTGATGVTDVVMTPR